MTGLQKELPSDLSKVLGEWALAAGRNLQSKQTGYIHDYYEGENQSGCQAQTIPFIENVLFVLALLRSRLVEQIQEAKTLLKGLLAFQHLQKSDSYGNFPIYLHEYPLCRDPGLALQVLSPFYWIIKQFGHVLGIDLKNQLEEATRLALVHSLKSHQINPFPYSLAVRLAAAQLSYGLLWEKLEWEEEGKNHLESLSNQQLDGWQTTKHLGDLLVGLQMVYPSIKYSPWINLWEQMEKTWHNQTGCYIGPGIKELQKGEEPLTNLYDLYAGYFTGQFSQRTTLLHSYHLHGVLIRPTSDKFNRNSFPLIAKGQWNQQAWHIVSSPGWAYMTMEKKHSSHPSIEKLFTPFRLIWGDIHRVHSFVCQGGHYEKVEYVINNHSVQLIFDLKDEPLIEPSLQHEVEFFVDFHPEVSFSLKDVTSTTFELGQEMVLSLGQHRLLLRFDLLQGEGNFLGHVMRANRPSQMDHKGEKRFQAYDWTFFLRTIRRQNSCRLRATLSFEIPSIDEL